MVSLLVPAIVDNHLNSKNNAIYSAAIGVIHALMENIGKTLDVIAGAMENIPKYQKRQRLELLSS